MPPLPPLPVEIVPLKMVSFIGPRLGFLDVRGPSGRRGRSPRRVLFIGRTFHEILGCPFHSSSVHLIQPFDDTRIHGF